MKKSITLSVILGVFLFISYSIAQPVCNAHFTFSQSKYWNKIDFKNSANSSGAHYVWDFGDGTTSTSRNPSRKFTTAGSYYVCLTVTDSNSTGTCSDTFCDSVKVTAPPPPTCNAHFTYSQKSKDWNKIYFKSPANSSGAHYSWDFGDGTTSTSNDPYRKYASAGSYYVCLTVTDSSATGTCSDTFCDSVKAAPPSPFCDAHFIYKKGPSANGIRFYSAYNSKGAHYAWSFGDGFASTSNRPVHRYGSSGVYYVCLTVTDSTASGTCSDTQCDSVYVNVPRPPTCDAYFTSHKKGSSANGIHFHPASKAKGAQYAWSFGDGFSSTSHKPLHVYASAGVYYACLTVTNSNSSGGCSDTYCDSIYVNVPAPPKCNAQFYVDYKDDDHHFRVHFKTYKSSTADYAWSFGDGSTSTSHDGSHTYALPGTYYVCLTVTDSNAVGTCSDTFCDSVHVTIYNDRMMNPNGSDAQVMIYPNPASEIISVSLANVSGSASFKLFDSTGRLVYSNEFMANGILKISTADIGSGLFFYQVASGDVMIAKGKLVVN